MRILRSAVRQDSALEGQLKEALAELDNAKEQVPRGSPVGLAIVGALFVGITWVVLRAYVFLREAFVSMWGSPDHWYLQTFRLDAARVWQALELIGPSYSLLVLAVPLVLTLWLLVRRLHRRLARTVLLAVGCAELVVGAFVLMNLFQLTLLPLIRG